MERLMVDETIRAIRETEQQADGIVKAAREKGQAIVSEAKENTEKLKADTIGRAKEEARVIEAQAKEEASRMEKEALRTIEGSILELKAAAGKKKSEAVSLVISELV